MRTYRGTHGTSQTRAEQILREGFQTSPVGRVGSGVYLWAYVEDAAVARELAEGWFVSQTNRNVYAGEPDATLSILYAEFDAEDHACIDCDAPEFQEKLTAYMRKLHGDADTYDEADINVAYNSLISLVEEKRGAECCIVFARVPPPKKMPFKERIFILYPLVYIIRRALESIRVTLEGDFGASEGWVPAV